MTLPPSQRAFSRVGSSTRCFSAALPSRAGRRDGWPQPRRHCATATAYVDGVHTQPDDPALAGVPAGNEGERFTWECARACMLTAGRVGQHVRIPACPHDAFC
eukprot:347468-Chlamydomonas_euryale.AAC.2